MTQIRLADCVTLKNIAPRIGSYSTAYALATAGKFGPPVAVLGRTQLFDRTAVESAITSYLTRRQRGGRVG